MGQAAHRPAQQQAQTSSLAHCASSSRMPCHAMPSPAAAARGAPPPLRDIAHATLLPAPCSLLPIPSPTPFRHEQHLHRCRCHTCDYAANWLPWSQTAPYCRHRGCTLSVGRWTLPIPTREGTALGICTYTQGSRARDSARLIATPSVTLRTRLICIRTLLKALLGWLSIFTTSEAVLAHNGREACCRRQWHWGM